MRSFWPLKKSPMVIIHYNNDNYYCFLLHRPIRDDCKGIATTEETCYNCHCCLSGWPGKRKQCGILPYRFAKTETLIKVSIFIASFRSPFSRGIKVHPRIQQWIAKSHIDMVLSSPKKGSLVLQSHCRSGGQGKSL
jgi:hypothetical protein